jgi:hypothetical protein
MLLVAEVNHMIMLIVYTPMICEESEPIYIRGYQQDAKAAK